MDISIGGAFEERAGEGLMSRAWVVGSREADVWSWSKV